MPSASGATETLSLPGIEGTTTLTEPRPGHWIERGPQKRLMLFAGRSNPELAEKIAERLGIELGEVTLKTFADGETYCKYEESIRGADVFLIQTGSGPVDRNLMELLIMINAAQLASAKRITVVVPWFPYSRQDKKSAPREPITAKLVADFLQVAGADRVLTMDLHAGQIQGFFKIPVDHMTALPLIANHFRDLGLSGEGVVSVSPDPGRAKMAVKFAQMLEADFAVMHKTRPGHDQVSVTEVTGRVRGKIAIIGDDIISTGGTLLAGAQALKDAGATEVWVFATHGLFSDGALERFAKADLAGVVVTDTVPIDPLHRPDNLTVLTVSSLLAETIWNVFSDDSVSAIFAGENQLF
jgi:ribose-phosphate pyrophosphokinase